VVILDEFQEISDLDGVAILKSMRSRFQHHKNAVYIFSGSKRHVLGEIFHETEGAFYKFARPMEIGPIPKAEFEGFLMDKFAGSGGKLGQAAAKRILDVSRGYPYYVQQVAHELFDISRTPSSENDVESAIRTAVEHQAPAFMAIWDTIKSPLHRKYLLAIAAEPRATHGTEFIERHRLRSRSHLQRIEKQLEARGVIERGGIIDPLFVLWLKTIKSTS
jgi:hypothetical protein